MKKLVLGVLVVALLAGVQGAGAQFCEPPGSAYLIQELSGDLQRLTVNPVMLTLVCSIGFQVNAIGIDDATGQMVGVMNVQPGNTDQLVMVDDDCSTSVIPVDLENGNYIIGARDLTGQFYFVQRGNDNALLTIDLTIPAIVNTVQTLMRGSDIAVNPGDGLIYTVINDTGEVTTVDPNTGALGGTGIFVTPAGLPGFGALMFDNNNDLWVYHDSGNLSSVDLDTGIVTDQGVVPTVQFNDGASCPSTFPVELMEFEVE